METPFTERIGEKLLERHPSLAQWWIFGPARTLRAAELRYRSHLQAREGHTDLLGLGRISGERINFWSLVQMIPSDLWGFGRRKPLRTPVIGQFLRLFNVKGKVTVQGGSLSIDQMSKAEDDIVERLFNGIRFLPQSKTWYASAYVNDELRVPVRIPVEAIPIFWTAVAKVMVGSKARLSGEELLATGLTIRWLTRVYRSPTHLSGRPFGQEETNFEEALVTHLLYADQRFTDRLPTLEYALELPADFPVGQMPPYQQVVWQVPGRPETFRIAEDGTYADSSDRQIHLSIDPKSKIQLAAMDKTEQQKWAQIFLDYRIPVLFQQQFIPPVPAHGPVPPGAATEWLNQVVPAGKTGPVSSASWMLADFPSGLNGIVGSIQYNSGTLSVSRPPQFSPWGFAAFLKEVKGKLSEMGLSGLTVPTG